MISETIKSKILKVLNVFETGSANGRYDMVVVMADGKEGTLQITYGRSQTTEQGNLKKLIELYIKNKGVFAEKLKPYLEKLGVIPLHKDNAFKVLLKKAAVEDSIMRDSQDEFFDKVYYNPAMDFFNENSFTLPLCLLVIYDSKIHSGGMKAFLKNKVTEKLPKEGGNEKEWIRQYTIARHNWLKNNANKLLQKTVYRTNCFFDQFSNENWSLEKPIKANGITIP